MIGSNDITRREALEVIGVLSVGTVLASFGLMPPEEAYAATKKTGSASTALNLAKGTALRNAKSNFGRAKLGFNITRTNRRTSRKNGKTWVVATYRVNFSPLSTWGSGTGRSGSYQRSATTKLQANYFELWVGWESRLVRLWKTSGAQTFTLSNYAGTRYYLRGQAKNTGNNVWSNSNGLWVTL